MNCASAEKLLPLYARVDLDGSSHSAVAAHLESCAHCRQLADEYKNIQGWIRLHEPPEFSEKFFAGIRQNVLREIDQRTIEWSPLSTWLRKLVAPTPRTVFAAATLALLIIFGAIGLMVFHEPKGTGESAARDERSEPKKDATVVNEKPVTLPTDDQSQAKNEPRSVVRFNGNSVNRGRRRIAETKLAAVKLPAQDKPVPAAEFDSGSSDGQAPLRVEIQTQNPDVRIIWFASNTKPTPSTK